MNAPLENRDLMAGVEELERRSLHAGVTTQSEDDPDDPIAKFARLLAQREGSCESVVEPPGPLPLSAGRKGDDSWDRDSLDKFEALLRTDSAAIETEVKDARPRTTGGASSKAATSNALPDSTGKLKSPRHRVKAAPSGPVGIADRAALRHSLYVRVGVVIVGLAGLGAGMAFWHNASSPLGASAIKAQTEPAKRQSQGVTGVDTPAQDSAIVDPPLAAPVVRHEQPFAASQPKTPSAIDPRDEGELTNQSASAPIPPAPTQTQAEPVGMAASPMTEKAETLSAPPFIVGIRPSAAPPPAAATLLPPQGAAAVAPPPRPKTGAAPKTAKPAVAAKLNNRSHPEQLVKPAKTIAPETIAKPGPTQPPIGGTEAPAPKPAAPPEADDPFAFFTHAQ